MLLQHPTLISLPAATVYKLVVPFSPSCSSSVVFQGNFSAVAVVTRLNTWLLSWVHFWWTHESYFFFLFPISFKTEWKFLRIEPFKMDERDFMLEIKCTTWLSPTNKKTRKWDSLCFFVWDGFVFKRICLKSLLFCLSYHLVTSLWVCVMLEGCRLSNPFCFGSVTYTLSDQCSVTTHCFMW